MNIYLINPNSTVSMTEKAGMAAANVVPAGVHLHSVTSMAGPAAIQGAADGELAVPPLLKELELAVSAGADAAIIACFDDTGLFEARERLGIPVIGIGQAAFHMSMLLGKRFSIVTTLAVSVPVIEQNIERYGMQTHCCRVRASDVPVLELEKPGSDAEHRVSSEIATALTEDKCDSIVLGCAGMTDLATRLQAQHGVPVIDGVVAAATLASAVVASSMNR